MPRIGLAGRQHAAPVVGLLAVFAVSRALLRAAHMEFDTGPIAFFWQYIDIRLLRHDLLRSLWYLHGQPPLYNLFLGVNLKLFPARVGTALHLEYLAMGVAIVLLVYVLAWRLTRRRGLAFALAVLFAVSPSVLLYENWLFYEYPVTLILLLSLLALDAFARRPAVYSGVAFFTSLAALVYLRATFQIFWFLLAVAVVLWTLPAARRLTLLCSAAPFAIVLGLYIKNEIVFGIPATSSWAGMNLAQVAFRDLSSTERQRMVADGELSNVSSLPPFSTLDHYGARLARTRHTGIPVLDERLKALHVDPDNPASGPYDYSNNFNNLVYVDLSKAYLHDALRLIWHHPGIYLAGVGDGLHLFMQPASSDGGVKKNAVRIDRWTDVFDTVVLLRFSSVSPIAWGIVLAYLVAISYGVVLLRRKQRGPPVLLFAWMTVVYLTVVISLGEVLENQRLRFCLDPLVLLIDAVAVCELLRARSLRRRG